MIFFDRFYFKKLSDEFDCGVVFEEVREDDAILPIFEEKIIGKVEKIDWAEAVGLEDTFLSRWNEQGVGGQRESVLRVKAQESGSWTVAKDGPYIVLRATASG